MLSHASIHKIRFQDNYEKAYQNVFHIIHISNVLYERYYILTVWKYFEAQKIYFWLQAQLNVLNITRMAYTIHFLPA